MEYIDSRLIVPPPTRVVYPCQYTIEAMVCAETKQKTAKYNKNFLLDNNRIVDPIIENSVRVSSSIKCFTEMLI